MYKKYKKTWCLKLNVKSRHPLKSRNHEDSLPTITRIFSLSRYLGISSYGRNLFFVWTVIVFGLLLAIVFVSIWKFIRLLTGVAVNTLGSRGLIGRLSGSIFYGNALLSLVFSIKFLASWKDLSRYWIKVDSLSGLNLPLDVRIRRRIVVVSIFIVVCALVEHTLSMMSATGFDVPITQWFQQYMLNSHGFLMQTYEYNTYAAIAIFIMSKVATMLWNFQDLIVIVVSMALTSRYHKLNMYVRQIVRNENKTRDLEKLGTEVYIQSQVWRRIREAFVRQAALVRQVDLDLGPLILLSNVNNFYFICLQLYMGIGHVKGDFIHTLYFFSSLGWLLFRACSVVLAASDVNIHSKRALATLYKCPGSGYNIEVKRLINQLDNDSVALSGMGLFNLNRQLMLQVAAAVLKYELVLLQYDDQD